MRDDSGGFEMSHNNTQKPRGNAYTLSYMRYKHLFVNNLYGK